MKAIVQWSGGKDSQATLIYTVKVYGKDNTKAIFCDTGWEHEDTYKHIRDVAIQMGVELITLKSKKYAGMVDLAVKKKRFPSTKARFCTEELKVKPMIDWILEQKESLAIMQGVRKDESLSRSKMSQHCRFFKFYFQPYKYDDNGKPKYHTYRKKDVLEWCKQYDDSILRPVFDWTGEQVMAYILENGQKPNPLYYKGSKRVGCYPCIMVNQSEIKSMLMFEPGYIDRINQAEIEAGSSFFPPTYIPKRFCSKRDKNGKPYPSLQDVVDYVSRNDMPELFEEERNCMSYYSICER